VVIAFFICWAPFHTQRITAFVTRLLDKANKSIISDAATKFQEILFFTSGKYIYIKKIYLTKIPSIEKKKRFILTFVNVLQNNKIKMNSVDTKIFSHFCLEYFLTKISNISCQTISLIIP